MGRLIIDGTSVYEIDEECLRKNRPSDECGVHDIRPKRYYFEEALAPKKHNEREHRIE